MAMNRKGRSTSDALGSMASSAVGSGGVGLSSSGFHVGFGDGVFDASVFPEVASSSTTFHHNHSTSTSNNDDSSFYVSPVMAICNEVRRRNVAAAWSSPLSFAVSSSISDTDTTSNTSTDPWENYQDPLLSTSPDREDDLDETNLCNCSAAKRGGYRKRSASASRASPKRSALSSPSLHSRSSHNVRMVSGGSENTSMMMIDRPMVCPICGKRRALLDRNRMTAMSSSGSKSHSLSGKPISPSRMNSTPSASVVSSAPSPDKEEDPQHAKHLLEATPQLRFLSPQSTDLNGGDPSGGQHSFFHQVLSGSQHAVQPKGASSSASSGKGTASGGGDAAHNSVYLSRRDRENQRAAAELASLLWTLAHEMSLEDFGAVESQVFTAVFGLVHDYNDPVRRLAGLAAVHALLSAPSADEEKKTIKFANTLSQALRTAAGDFEFLSSVTAALGKMARRSANVDFVESEVTRALEWLRTDRSDRRLAACLALREFAVHAPTTFHSRTSQHTVGQGGSNQFIDSIFQAIRDQQPIVRACAADALSQCLKILVDRRHLSLTGLLCQIHFSLMEGLNEDTSRKRPWHAIAKAEASQHGSLLVVSTMLAFTGDFMLPRYHEVCRAVLGFCDCPKALIRLEVVRLIPRLARRRPRVFGRHFLEKALAFLLESASTPVQPRVGVDVRATAFDAIGQLVLAMTDEETGALIGGARLPTLKITDDPEDEKKKIVELSQNGITHEKLEEIFGLVRNGLSPSATTRNGFAANTVSAALYCATNLVEALGDSALPYLDNLIDMMFQAGLSIDLIRCLHAIAQCIPAQQSEIEDRMLQEVSLSLAGVRNLYNSPLGVLTKDVGGKCPAVTVNMSNDPQTVHSLVLSLHTLASFGGRAGQIASNGTIFVPLLPFLNDVVARYLRHPAAEVRRAASLTCCMLAIPHEAEKNKWGGYSGLIVEEILDALLQVAVSDNSAIVRLCVVRALDSRYDSFLAQSHHLQRLFVLLQDETLATRAAGIRLLGRLTLINPPLILPVLRQFLGYLISELQCGVNTGRGREEATRLLVVFLRAKALKRLVHPVLGCLIETLPLDRSAPPRLASASLEALGDLAIASGVALRPWIHTIIPHVLEIMQDQSSASKQRTSLRTLGQIAGSTGYVIRPYLDYPRLLSQATDILPATKRAPWSLRREVIRTLGILGALDPDRYHAVGSKTRKRGAVGGAYFEETDPLESDTNNTKNGSSEVTRQRSSIVSEDSRQAGTAEEDKPAYLFMYEQYAMVAQPVSNLVPPRRLTPSDEEFYPTIAVQALMRIFRDPALTVHHGTVAQAIMFIFKSLGLGCVSYLKIVVPHIIQTIRNCSATLRESLLKQLATLSLIVREHLRPYVAEIFDVTVDLWDSRHLATIFGLISNIAVGVPDEFKKFGPRLIRKILTSLDELQVADWRPSNRNRVTIEEQSQKLALILANLGNLRDVLRDYLHILVPALLKLADSLATISASGDSGLSKSVLAELSILTYRTMSSLLESLEIPVNPISKLYFPSNGSKSTSSEHSLPVRAVHPIVRILKDKPPSEVSVGMAMVETLCVCSRQIGYTKWLSVYDEVAREAVTSWISTFPEPSRDSRSNPSQRPSQLASILQLYDKVVGELSRPLKENVRFESKMTGKDRATSMIAEPSNNNLVQAGEGGDMSFEQPVSPRLQPMQSTALKRQVNPTNLQRAWDVSQRSSMEDWDEWMRRLGIELLQQAPNPALRACASLAHAYQPLARELFCAAFACCWGGLAEAYRLNLVHALETAFEANISPEILQALLNLAEFMEQDPSGGLPIDIGVLADLALKCRSYAKALHYKEKEHKQSASNATVESLISINRKLDLQEAGLGILKVSSLGDALVNDVEFGKELSTQFAKHHAYDMCYSVMWNTEERHQVRVSRVDITAKQELWLSKLGSWAEALAVYEEKVERDPQDFEATLGCMRCLDVSGEWRKVLDYAENNWNALSGDYVANVSPRSQRKAIRMCAHAAWRLGNWDELEKYAGELVQGSKKKASDYATSPSLVADTTKTTVDFDGAFFSAISCIHRKEWASAAEAIDVARKAMDGRLTALLAESYSRAYTSMVTAQTLSEMEEIIEYRKLEERSNQSAHLHPANRPSHSEARERLLSVWQDRLSGCRRDAEAHASILAVRSLVLGPRDDVDSILTLSDLSRQANRIKFAERVLLDPLNAMDADLDGPTFGMSDSLNLEADHLRLKRVGNSHSVVIERILQGDITEIVSRYSAQHENWSKSIIGDAGGQQHLSTQYRLYHAFVRHLWFTQRREAALSRMGRLCEVIDMITKCEDIKETELLSKCLVDRGEWTLADAVQPNSHISQDIQIEVLTSFKRAISLEGCGYKGWHAWALLNFRIAIQSTETRSTDDGIIANRLSNQMLRNHVVAAVNGFVNAISLGTVKDVATVITGSIGNIAIEAWLGILPQLLARIHIKQPNVRSVLHPLLVKLGEAHPQAFIYPLSVLLKSPVAERKSAAQSLMNSLKAHSSQLVDEALLVSSELIGVAILWLETWHEGLEDASRLYFGDNNTAGMLELLLPLHENLERGATTQRENEFLAVFGQDLAEAHFHIKEYIRLTSSNSQTPQGLGSQNRYESSESVRIRQNEEAETSINKAWDIYYTVFRRINKQLPSLTKLELSHCSPALSGVKNLILGIPGSYRVDGSYVKIHKFVPKVQVISSKQRPRKITLRGNDGKDYVYLLKGHEDLRQDERVMQLFGLVNALLARDPQTKKHDLSIQRYAIAPLSHNCGLVGWVPHTDTFHSLIRDYRQSKDIVLNMENREMLKLAPDYELLTVMQKVEVFTQALKNTTGHGDDLYEILWLKSTNSEEWLERRTTFTRSLAVMSMVGYILGLGDRHPSNLMLDKVSGRVLHIDFGDCFEVAKNRDKFPEKVPFRLTRMLIKAMEVAGIEGSYRSTCERTMSVLRNSRDSLVAMLEAFVYDPLISWRLAGVSGETPRNASNANRRHGTENGVDNGARSAAQHGTMMGRSHMPGPAIFEDEEEEGEEEAVAVGGPPSNHSKARSMRIYADIQQWAANIVADDRIASIAGRGTVSGDRPQNSIPVEGSLARSRRERSMRQREVMSMLDGEDAAVHEGALNEKALKVIRRVQDKLNGTDFPDTSTQEGGDEPLDVPDQVQRLIVQATSSENLCQLFIGWCAFW